MYVYKGLVSIKVLINTFFTVISVVILLCRYWDVLFGTYKSPNKVALFNSDAIYLS